MRITDLLKANGLALQTKASSKEEVFELLFDLHDKCGNITSKEGYKKGIMAREAQGPTAIADGICIPHTKCDAVKTPGLCAATVPGGVDCDALDGNPSDLFFMIAAPATGSDVHLEVLSRLSTILMDADFRAKLLATSDPQEFLSIIDAKEDEKFGEEVKKEAAPAPAKGGYRVLCVTACPTGIAHTYMAAESLEEKGKEMGIAVKAETNGSGGAKNILTKEEIANCDGIIIAADKNVEMARFDGKPVIKTKVQDGIHKPQELIEKIINGEAPIYHHEGGAATEEEAGEGLQLYKHLMNGVSHMLPFVIGGGILIAIAFLLDDYSINPGNFGMNTPIAAFFKQCGGAAFGFMLPILAGYIAMSIADRPGLMPGFVGGSLAASGMTFASAFDGEIAVVSGGFIGALFAGFAAGYIVKGLKKITDKMPQSMDGLRPMLIYPVVGLFCISVVMLALNPVFGLINTGLNNFLNGLGGANAILLGAIVGGMMSIDMGGPFNKASYVFGTGALAAQTAAGFKVMAAVMAGGMVPPIAIAIASMVFKNKFTDNDRKGAPVNAIMGLCFISEAAIPFAAADPTRVIPSCVIGSAVAGALSELFGCTLMAPHGGVFVIATVGNPIMYIAAILIGSIVGAVLLGVLKKAVK